MKRTPQRRARTRPLSIGALSRATGIPAETIRTWERRYGNPTPLRKPSGHRIYPAASVERLRRVARLLTHGHRPAEILGLSVPQLEALLSLSDPREGRKEEAPERAVGRESVERILESLVEAGMGFDRDSLVRELRASWGRLGPLRFLEEVSGPFLQRIGQYWEEGRVEIRHEHFAWACISGFLREVREPYDQDAKGPLVAAALLPGDAHEGGLLMASVVLAIRGCRVIYLGADIPVEQVAATVASGGIENVVISVSAGVPRAKAEREIARLRHALPHRAPLWVGGAGAPGPAPGVERFGSLTALAERLGPRV